MQTGAATMRHVGLVALEALLVAAIAWVAAMTFAGATQSEGGVTGAANAGRGSASLAVPDVALGGSTVATAAPGEAGMWVHATCVRSASRTAGQWARIGAGHTATLSFGRNAAWSSGGATCTAEEGYFATNGRWRVVATTTFSVRG